MKNKIGFLLGILSAITYTLIHSGLNLYLPALLGSIVGAILIPLIISGLIFLFKRKNFGYVFGITSIITHVVSSLGTFLAN